MLNISLNIAFVFLTSLFVSLNAQQSAKFGLPYGRLQTIFQAQLHLSIPDTSQDYLKTLVWFENGQFKQVSHQHSILDTLRAVLMQELKPAIDVLCLNPEISEWFDIQESCSRVVAKRKPNSDSKTRLEYQVLQLNADCNKIDYIETVLSRDNWLYQERIRIRVFFDSQGKYRHHQTEIMTDVPLSGAFVLMISKGCVKAK